MTRPFEGVRIIDITHVLAGPFAAYQLAVLGADVIKVEHPEEPDQSREGGTDRALNRRNMGTSFLTQGSNKQSITLNLKTEEGREILKKLVARSDVLVENYRPGAFEALGLGYEAMAKINPRLIYCSMSAFGQGGVSKLPMTMLSRPPRASWPRPAPRRSTRSRSARRRSITRPARWAPLPLRARCFSASAPARGSISTSPCSGLR